MGSYCDDLLTAKPCPSGTYGNRTGATSQANGCASCPAGYFCIPGTVGYPSKALRCPPGHYCPAGTTTQYQYPCPNGKFSRNVGNERSDQCENCPVGYYCQGGDRTGDTLCPLGHYCPIGTASRSQHPCPAGYYTEEMGSRSEYILKYLVPKIKQKTLINTLAHGISSSLIILLHKTLPKHHVCSFAVYGKAPFAGRFTHTAAATI